MTLLRVFAAATLIATLLFAAGVDGNWKTSFTTPDGQTREGSLTLKADGEKVTGKLASARGDSEIKDGTLKGDDLTFTVVRNFGGQDVTFTYKGKVSGDKIAFKVSAGDREFDMTAVRQ